MRAFYNPTDCKNTRIKLQHERLLRTHRGKTIITAGHLHRLQNTAADRVNGPAVAAGINVVHSVVLQSEEPEVRDKLTENTVLHQRHRDFVEAGCNGKRFHPEEEKGQTVILFC